MMPRDLQQVRDAINADRSALCHALGLRPDGDRFFCPACQEDGQPHADGDLSIEAGFKCHRCEKTWDGFLLVRQVRGCGFAEAVEFVQKTYGTSTVHAASNPPTGSKQSKPKRLHPDLDAAARAAEFGATRQNGHSWRLVRTDVYHDATGKEHAAEFRFDRADGACEKNGKPVKTYRTAHAVSGGWMLGDPPGKWYPFNAPKVVSSAGVVYVVEGPKSVRAGAEIGLVCTTSAYGAGNARKTDWSILSDRDVVILPDADKAGREYADAVAQLAHTAGARTVRIVEFSGQKSKEDLVDFLEARDAQPPEAIRAEIWDLVSAAPPWVPSPGDEVEDWEDPLVDPLKAARGRKPVAQTDLGNAERLVFRHRNRIRWDVAHKAWRIWDGARWALDARLQIHRLAAETVRSIREEAAAVPPGTGGKRDLGQTVFAHAVRSESRERLTAMIELAKSFSGIAVEPDAWDAGPWLFNVKNGTINLKTGLLQPHRREDMLTKLAPVLYGARTRCARWEDFLRDATGGDEEVIRYLQKVVGYTLTGLVSEEILILIHGPEASGKTTFLESVRAVFGEYACTINPDMLTKQKSPSNASGPSPDLARLKGVRLAAGSEIEGGRELAEALVKSITGGEAITARHLHAEFFDFTPQFTVWIAANHCPRASADDGAIWRRIKRVGFEHTVAPERRDKTLKPYLRDPDRGGAAVLAWAVEGCLLWQREGLREPAAVRESTDAYRAEGDPLAMFVEDRLAFHPQAWTLWSEIWNAYTEHAGQAGTLERYWVSPKRIQERLKFLGCTTKAKKSGRGWLGVELHTDWSGDGGDGGDTFSRSSPHDSLPTKDLRIPSPPSPMSPDAREESAGLPGPETDDLLGEDPVRGMTP